MKITKFKIHLENLFKEKGQGFFFGSMQKYIMQKEIQDVEIICEPFEVPLVRDGLCRIVIDVIMYAGVVINNKKTGDDYIYMQEVADTVQEVVETLEASEKLHILTNAENIRFRYIESASINNQIWGRFPLKIQVNGFF